MTIRVSAIAALSDNYIWVIDDGETAIVVDPGEAVPVARHLQQAGLTLAAVLLTHHHQDHVGGVEDLLRLHGQVSPRAQAPAVHGPAASGIAGVTHAAMEGDELAFGRGSLCFSVLGVPGHTLDHLVYLANSPGSTSPGHLFCGDTLFSCGCGRVFEGSPAQMVASLQKLRDLPPSTLVYPAHEYTLHNIQFALQVEPENEELRRWAVEAGSLRRRGLPTLPSTIGRELAVNPFLRLDSRDVVTRAMASLGATGREPPAVFAALRTARNAFRTA